MSGWNPSSNSLKPRRSGPGQPLWIWWLLCLLGPLLASCSKREPPAVAQQILRLSQRNEPATLDPQQATLPDEFFIIRALSQGLVTPDPNGGPPLPAAAESWETSTDGLTWTFYLRPNATWSNGDPVTASDFVFTFQRALDPVTAAPKANLFAALKESTALDTYTLVLTLKSPTPDLLALAASGPWIPVNPRIAADPTSDWTRAKKFVGNGPFTLDEWAPHQRIIVRQNLRYRDSKSTKITEIQFLAFDNGDTEERAFRANQVDVTMSVPASKLEPYRKNQADVLRTVPLHETRYLTLNTNRAPLNDPKIRRALSLALDRRALTEKVLKGGQRPAFTFIPPGLGGFKSGATLTENIAEARQLLAQAGFPDGRNFPSLELSTWGASITVLEAIQQRWQQELGVRVSLLQREARTHLAALASGDYDIGFVTAIPDYDSPTDLLRDLESEAPGNYPHWSNPDFDALLKNPPDLATAVAAEKIILNEMPVIPLYFNTQNFLIRPEIKNWQTDRLWTRFYENVTKE